LGPPPAHLLLAMAVGGPAAAQKPGVLRMPIGGLAGSPVKGPTMMRSDPPTTSRTVSVWPASDRMPDGSRLFALP